MNTKIITLDVRPDFRSGLHPREKIQTALMELCAGEALRLQVPFEPVPMLHWAAGQGLAYQSTCITEGDWEVLFTRGAVAEKNLQVTTEIATQNQQLAAASAIIELDARGLEPPQPLVRILEAATRLPQGASLRARTDRRPIHLFSPLQERGFIGESEEQSDGSFITHIQHA